MEISQDLRTSIGFDPETGTSVQPGKDFIEFINLKLAALGEPIFGQAEDFNFLSIGRSLMAHYQAKEEWQEEILPPVDRRVQAFLDEYLKDIGETVPRLPARTLTLSQHGMARTLSLPPDQDVFKSSIIESYRLANGVLHNPASDRRTTQGVFHVTEGGLPIPADKKAVPKVTFCRLLKAALQAPADIMRLPFTSSQEQQAHVWLSLLLRPVVCPEIPGFTPEKSMEVRFFAPGNLACNLDFVESIFGNAGDPFLRENDAGLDVEHWSGHTGCVFVVPHILGLKKKDLGLPHVSKATARQKRDGMCWEKEDEIYNDGGAFKITCRDTRGIVVTLISDNYFGYCKKEVKTQISYATNLMGIAEEEHAGGALAFASYDLGEDFKLAEYMSEDGYSMAQVQTRLGDRLLLMPEGYGIDRTYPEVFYIPAGAEFSLPEQTITWPGEGGKERSLKLLAGRIYVLPNGYQVRLIKPAEGRRWRLIGTVPHGAVCHKPCTVSGGGKSEISKSIADATIAGPLYVQDLQKDFDFVEKIINRDYRDRFKEPAKHQIKGRSILSPDRSLGSVIKLLTPSEEFTDEHNAFVRSIPVEIKELVFVLKRFYKEEWGANWRERFTVDVINGTPGHELKYRNNPVITSYLRVGYQGDGAWRVFNLRKDFSPAEKIQFEDDITASVVIDRSYVPGLDQEAANPSVKVVHNCEYRLFQRPDDAIVRGYDKRTEKEMSRLGVNFFSNYQPLTRKEAREMTEDAVRFDYFTEPMQDFVLNFVENPEKHPKYMVCSANPRLVDGKPSKNPRYLQNRIGLEEPRTKYVADVAARLYRRLKPEQPVLFPVSAVLTGRRNNPPEAGIRALAVHNPIHYLPLPEAFMEFISSMTGRSPSTTGAGSEGALTKGPFNAVLPIYDLNAALVDFIVTGYEPWVTAAGYVGPKFRVDHDISLLVPEIWCRMRPQEREPQWLIANGFLERVPDLVWEGKKLPGGPLGYRINEEFVAHFLGRIFTNPSVLFSEEMLRPEKQDLAIYADGVDNILTTHTQVAKNYFEDGSYEAACPPLKAILEIMRDGRWADLDKPEVRKLFDRETVLKSDWYKARLSKQQEWACAFAQRQVAYIEGIRHDFPGRAQKLEIAKARYAEVCSPAYLQKLTGTIGRETATAV